MLPLAALLTAGTWSPMRDLEITVDTLWDGTPAEPSEVVHVRLGDGGDHLILTVDAPFHADPPPIEARGSTWRLWNHEVVELFVLGMNDRYLEVEVGPHGHYIVLQLDGARNPVQTHLPLDLDARIEGERWTATARIPRTYLPLGADRINVTAIHGTGEERRYLSWQELPGNGPDFHRIERFGRVELP